MEFENPVCVTEITSIWYVRRRVEQKSHIEAGGALGRVRQQQDMLGHTAYTKGLVEHNAILSIGKGAARVLPDNRTWALGHMLGHTSYTMGLVG